MGRNLDFKTSGTKLPVTGLCSQSQGSNDVIRSKGGCGIGELQKSWWAWSTSSQGTGKHTSGCAKSKNKPYRPYGLVKSLRVTKFHWNKEHSHLKEACQTSFSQSVDLLCQLKGTPHFCQCQATLLASFSSSGSFPG